jgi:hypothetical protein
MDFGVIVRDTGLQEVKFTVIECMLTMWRRSLPAALSQSITTCVSHRELAEGVQGCGQLSVEEADCPRRIETTMSRQE